MEDPIKILGVQDDEFVVNPGTICETITLPKLGYTGQTVRIKNLSDHPVVIRPQPGDSFADKTSVRLLKAEAIAIRERSYGKTISCWEFVGNKIRLAKVS